jgi:threonine dehydrogenase-like Zn-dependent dehydrogenase
LEWDETCRFVTSHRLVVQALITPEFSIEEAAEASRAFDARETEKAVFVWN